VSRAAPSGLDRAACYRALQTRDARFDGRFFTAVTSTGIYCRPICPAKPPKLENCLFLPSAAAAHQLGFRPCLRCRPETAPGLGGWRGTGATVSRGLRLIAEGALNEAGVEALADRLGVTDRHLRRLFDAHVGAGPVAVAQSQRLLLAKALLSDSTLPLTDVALAAGFGSLRRFNDAFLRAYGRAPSAFRRSQGEPGAGLRLRLPFAPPYDWAAMAAYLAARATPGVETASPDAYARTFRIGPATGVVRVAPDRNAALAVQVETTDVRALGAIATRVRALFDLDADIGRITASLGGDPTLAALVSARPGLRAPGAWDGFEYAVRAILGQQVSVAAASTLAGRLCERFGVAFPGGPGLERLFPEPAGLAQAALEECGVLPTRARAIRALADAVARNPALLAPEAAPQATLEALLALPGIGPWTASMIALRALGDPDAFPAGDLVLRKAMGGLSAAALERASARWRPWRAYAAQHLWASTA
jgi:AraC family transcriptional regulator of adaptative response / DNA-3-methyladenine glycosylase II